MTVRLLVTARKMPHYEPADPLHLLQVILSSPNFSKKEIRGAQMITLLILEHSGEPQTLVGLRHAPLRRCNAASSDTVASSSPGVPGEGGALAENITQPLVEGGTHSGPSEVDTLTELNKATRRTNKTPFNQSIPPLMQTSLINNVVHCRSYGGTTYYR